MAIVVGLMAGLVLLEPDLGTSTVLGFTAFTMFFVAGANLVHLAVMGGVGGSAVFFAAVAAQALVILMFVSFNIGYLWYNLIGCAAVLPRPGPTGCSRR